MQDRNQPARLRTMIHPSLADIPEGVLVQHLLSDRDWRSRVLGIRGIPDNALAFEKVLLASAPEGFEGDVDILLCAKNQPNAATAIEVKRVKVGASAFRGGWPSKLNKFSKGVRQANLLARVGFSQVYLFVLVVVDSREQNAGRISYEGPTSDQQGIIRSRISTRNLAQRVGLMHYEFVQPMDHTPLGVGTYSANLERIAETVLQPDALTRWVAQVIAERAA